MTVPRGGPERAERRTAFSLRQSVLFFGLVAIALCAVGLTVKLVVRAAGEHPGAAVVATAAVCTAAALLRTARRRRAVGRVADGLVDLTHEIAAQSGPDLERRTGAPVLEVDEHEESIDATDYAAMDPSVFEQSVAALCERDGCRGVQVVGGAGDLGADIMATTPDGRSIVIQCKRYGPVNKVGSQDVQRFGGTCFAVHEADVAVVVTTGEFTQPALEYAEHCGIRCWDLRRLVAWSDGSGPLPWDEVDGEAAR
ncbi:restriction endonuclease [Streptomyces sp. NPDC057445]|uniref:restriction endonuclease n=1 Tax=Streptomyces sp. NPDC057445 TaxID=3346136 RepID=UPI0036B0B95E